MKYNTKKIIKYLLLEWTDEPQQDREEEVTRGIQRIIMRKQVQVGQTNKSNVLYKLKNVNMVNAINVEGGSFVEKNKKVYIVKTIVEGFCDQFTPTNIIMLRRYYMMEHLGLLVEKPQAKHIIYGTWSPPQNLIRVQSKFY